MLGGLLPLLTSYYRMSLSGQADGAERLRILAELSVKSELLKHEFDRWLSSKTPADVPDDLIRDVNQACAEINKNLRLT